MSHIDLFKHKKVGQIADIAVYQALEDIDSDEISCKKNQFIIGGGGGEHNAATIKDIRVAVSTYLLFTYEDFDIDEHDEYINYSDNIDLNHWTISDFVRLDRKCRELGFSENNDIHTIEIWLNCEIGKLVLSVAQELVDNELLDFYRIKLAKPLFNEGDWVIHGREIEQYQLGMCGVEKWKPTKGELCIFWDHDDGHYVIAKYGQSHFKYSGTYEENYDHIAPYAFTKTLNKYPH